VWRGINCLKKGASRGLPIMQNRSARSSPDSQVMLNRPLPTPQGPATPGRGESLGLEVGGVNPVPSDSSIGAVSRGNRYRSGLGDCNARGAAEDESRVQRSGRQVRSAINTKPLGGFPRGFQHFGLDLSTTCAGSPRLAALRAKCRPLRPMRLLDQNNSVSILVTRIVSDHLDRKAIRTGCGKNVNAARFHRRTCVVWSSALLQIARPA